MGYGEDWYSVVVPAGATTVSKSFGPGTRQRTWMVTQVTVEMPLAPNGATCRLTKNGVLVTPLIPTGDAAGAGPPVRLFGQDLLTVTWAGVTAGLTGTIWVAYDEEA